MRYSKIIALIDAYLEQLQTARQLLLKARQSPFPKTKTIRLGGRGSLPVQPAHLPTPAGPVLLPTPLVELTPASSQVVEVAAAPQQIPVEPLFHRVPAARQRRSSSARTPTQRASQITALSSAVPAGPVYVPANQVRSDRTSAQEKDLRLQALVNAQEALTVESLTRRWLQSPKF